MSRAIRYLGLLAVLWSPTPASAQFLGPLEGLFRKIDGVTIFATMGSLTSAERLTTSEFLGMNVIRGMGVEVLIDLAEQSVDSSVWGLELAFGVDYLTGFEARNRNIDLRGSIRGLPTLSTYATPPVDWSGFTPYLGLNVGFVQLWKTAVYDREGRQIPLSGDTFQMGFALGIFHQSGFFFETSYRIRDFRSVERSVPPDFGSDPNDLPRSLDLSAVLFNMGFQFGSLTEE